MYCSFGKRDGMGEREERRGMEDKYEWLGENWTLTLPGKEKKVKWWKNTNDNKLMPRRKNKGMPTIVLHMIDPCLYLQSLVEKESYRQSSLWFTSIPVSVTAVVGSRDTWNHRRQLEAEEGISRHYLSEWLLGKGSPLNHISLLVVCNFYFIPSVQFSSSVVSDSLRPHESQHARPLCPPPTPGVHSNSRPSSQWCHPAISTLVVPISSCLQSLPASESFPISPLFAWGGQSTGVSALASFLPKNTQDFRMDWLDLRAVQGTLKSLLQHHSSNIHKQKEC